MKLQEKVFSINSKMAREFEAIKDSDPIAAFNIAARMNKDCFDANINDLAQKWADRLSSVRGAAKIAKSKVITEQDVVIDEVETVEIQEPVSEVIVEELTEVVIESAVEEVLVEEIESVEITEEIPEIDTGLPVDVEILEPIDVNTFEDPYVAPREEESSEFEPEADEETEKPKRKKKKTTE